MAWWIDGGDRRGPRSVASRPYSTHTRLIITQYIGTPSCWWTRWWSSTRASARWASSRCVSVWVAGYQTALDPRLDPTTPAPFHTKAHTQTNNLSLPHPRLTPHAPSSPNPKIRSPPTSRSSRATSPSGPSCRASSWWRPWPSCRGCCAFRRPCRTGRACSSSRVGALDGRAFLGSV